MAKTDFVLSVDRRAFFDTMANAQDQSDLTALIGHRICGVILAGDCDWKDAIALEVLAGISIEPSRADEGKE